MRFDYLIGRGRVAGGSRETAIAVVQCLLCACTTRATVVRRRLIIIGTGTPPRPPAPPTTVAATRRTITPLIVVASCPVQILYGGRRRARSGNEFSPTPPIRCGFPVCAAKR